MHPQVQPAAAASTDSASTEQYRHGGNVAQPIAAPPPQPHVEQHLGLPVKAPQITTGYALLIAELQTVIFSSTMSFQRTARGLRHG